MYDEEKAAVLDDCLISVRRTFIRSVIGTASVLGIAATVVFGDPTLLHADSLTGVLASLKTDMARLIERAPQITAKFARNERRETPPETMPASGNTATPMPTPVPAPSRRVVLVDASALEAMAQQPPRDAPVELPQAAPQPVLQVVAELPPVARPVAPVAEAVEPAPVSMSYVRHPARGRKSKAFMTASIDPNGMFMAGGGPGTDAPPPRSMPTASIEMPTPVAPPPVLATAPVMAAAPVVEVPITAAPVPTAPVAAAPAIVAVQTTDPTPPLFTAQPVLAAQPILVSLTEEAAHPAEQPEMVWIRLPMPKPPLTPAQRLGLQGKERAKQEKCLAQAVYFEARAEPVRGQMAVAQVVMNRVFSPYYPKDVCSVVYQNASHHLACQFTFTCDGKPETIRERGAWARANRIARETLDAKVWLPEVAKATHYHAAYVHPYWARGMRKMARFGLHTFYRPRNWGDGSKEPAWGAGAIKNKG